MKTRLLRKLRRRFRSKYKIIATSCVPSFPSYLLYDGQFCTDLTFDSLDKAEKEIRRIVRENILWWCHKQKYKKNMAKMKEQVTEFNKKYLW